MLQFNIKSAAENNMNQDIKRYVLKSSEVGRYIIYTPPFEIQIVIGESLISESTLGYAQGKLLEILTENAGEIVSRESIFSNAWPDRVVSANSLNQAISLTRQLIGDDELHKAIKTIPRRGYTFDSSFILSENESKIIIDKAFKCNFNEILVEVDKAAPQENPRAVLGDIKNSSSFFYSQKMRFFRYLIIGVIAIGLLFRTYSIFYDDWSYSSTYVNSGKNRILYIASSNEEIKKIKTSLEPLVARFSLISDLQSLIIFNKMHEFYNIVCLTERSAPKFITVHVKKTNEVADQQILSCLQ